MASLSSKLKPSLSGFSRSLSEPLAPPSVTDIDEAATGLEMLNNLEMPDELEMT
jgi:hypothetical protein